MAKGKVHVSSPTGLAHDATVYVDGKPIDGVRSLRYSLDAATGIAELHMVIDGATADLGSLADQVTVAQD